RDAAPRHEVHAVHPHQSPGGRDGLRQARRPLEQPRVIRELGVARGTENAAAVAEPVGAEAALTGENARQAQRHGTPAVGGEHDRSRDARDALLQVAAARHPGTGATRTTAARATRSRSPYPSTATTSYPARAADSAKPRVETPAMSTRGISRDPGAGGPRRGARRRDDRAPCRGPRGWPLSRR